MALILVVLAAGMGSRFGGPKQLTPVGPNGESILDYNLRHGTDAGFDRLVVVTRPELLDQVTARVPGDVVVTLQDIPDGRAKPYGTAHAVMTAAAHVDDAFAVCNADDLYGADAFAALARQLRTTPDDAAIVGFTLQNTVPERGAVSRALLVCEGDAIRSVIEVHGIERRGADWVPATVDGFGAVTGDALVSMNLIGLPLSVMAEVERAVADFIASGAEGEVFLPHVVNDLARQERVRVRLVTGAGQWVGLTNPEDLDVVRAHLARG